MPRGLCKTLAALVTHSPEAPSWLSLASIGWGATKRAEASCETRGQSTFTVLAAKSRERKQATRVRLGVDASVIRSCFVYRLHDASSAVVFGRTRGRHLSSVASEDIHVNVDVLATPNEHAVKMLPGCDVTGHVRTVSIRKKDVDSAEKTSLLVLARTLLAIDGVTSLLFGYDFVTVVKDPCMEWEPIQEAVVSIIEAAAREAMRTGEPMAPLLGEFEKLRPLQPELETDGETVAHIIQLLDEKVIPNVQADGGDVQFRGFSDGIVWISMVGSCASCASSNVTVRFMIRNLLTHYVDQVRDVRSIGEDEDLALELEAIRKG